MRFMDKGKNGEVFVKAAIERWEFAPWFRKIQCCFSSRRPPSGTIDFASFYFSIAGSPKSYTS